MQSRSESPDLNTSGKFGRHANPAAVVASVVALIGLAVWAVVYGLDGDIDALIDWKGAIVVVATPILILTGIFGWAAPIDAFFYVVGKREDSAAARDAAQFFQLWAAFALASGFVATVGGLIVMLKYMDDPSKIGPGMAVALLSQLYGVCIAVFCLACSVVVLRRYPDRDASRRLTRQAVAGAGMTVVAGTMATLIAFGILMIAFMQSA
ncbi:MAG: MotA/TolQ/ExbB proton channel family protein [Phycisphaerales bacterium]|nr:MotA/TolQ/ExbB proton channel family protein [Phycisphaerales bacterium]MCB9864822.1 MotA/TolQ/ExbB proton channel family protein [Phycisphaerales bacterium]